MHHYSQTAGFILEGFGEIPEDAVELTHDEVVQLFTAQAQGKRIIPDETGRPIAVDNVIPTEDLAEGVRITRNKLLSDCDWTQLADCPLSVAEKEAWQVYRQELRDITDQIGFPVEVVYPVKP